MDDVHFEIQPQPDDVTCGPTCLQAVYRFFGDDLPLDRVIAECPQLDEGGTLASMLACHALQRGYRARIYSFNLRVLDPTWFADKSIDLRDKLRAQMALKQDPKLRIVSLSYLDFLERGGQIRMDDLKRSMIRKYLRRSIPILVGLSATYLYQTAREIASTNAADDVRGMPVGHFVVLCGYNQDTKRVRIADPYLPNPFATRDHYYEIDVDRVVCAILLGIVTFDANLLILRPKE